MWFSGGGAQVLQGSNPGTTKIKIKKSNVLQAYDIWVTAYEPRRPNLHLAHVRYSLETEARVVKVSFLIYKLECVVPPFLTLECEGQI